MAQQAEAPVYIQHNRPSYNRSWEGKLLFSLKDYSLSLGTGNSWVSITDKYTKEEVDNLLTSLDISGVAWVELWPVLNALSGTILTVLDNASGYLQAQITSVNIVPSDVYLQLEMDPDNPTYFSRFTYTDGDLTQKLIYSDPELISGIYTKDYTYTSGNLSQVVTTDLVNSATLTKNLTYDTSGNIEGIDKIFSGI